MLSKCANPECSAKFRYLHDGKVFRVELEAANHSAKPQAGDASHPNLLVIAARPARRPEYFWLCSQCSEHMTVGTDAHGIVLVPVVKPVLAARSAAAAASSTAA
jgi:hypothetical protein